MFRDIVDKEVEQLAAKMVRGQFHIGLEAVKKYVMFWCMANHLQKQQENQKMSILQYAQGKLRLTEKEREKLQPEKIEKLRANFYERKIDHYHTLNAENKVRHLLLHEQESHDRMIKKAKNQNEKGNARRFEGNTLFPYQIDEFSVLDAIKEGEHEDVKANKTYKRIVSEKGYLGLMTFKEFKEYVEVLTEEIERSDDTYKNIRYYKLEKRLGFEALKSVLKALADCRERDEVPIGIALKDLSLVLHLPFLSERQRYAEVYPELNVEEQMKWRLEIQGLLTFVKTCLVTVQYIIHESKTKEDIFDEQDWEQFKTIYLPDTFRNDYKQRKDFSSEDFTLFMKELDKQNTQVMQQIKAKLQKGNE
jgi:uncharacterized small protein (DUF1192 family)